MKYRIKFETRNQELHRIIWDEIRDVCMKHSVVLTGDRKTYKSSDEVTLIAEIRGNKKLNKDNPEGDQLILL